MPNNARGLYFQIEYDKMVLSKSFGLGGKVKTASRRLWRRSSHGQQIKNSFDIRGRNESGKPAIPSVFADSE
jgi:hypothetical protein